MNQIAFERIFIIMFENEAQSAVMQNPYMRDLAANGVRLSNYFGVTHPSQPNYIASVAGSTCGVMDDSTYDIEGQSIIDLLEAKDISWRAYMEDLPEDDKSVAIYDNLYYRKHNPFISFNNIRNNPKRLANIVNAHRLIADLQNNALPSYSWYTPNIQNDGHTPPRTSAELYTPSYNIDYLSNWLKGFLTPLLANPSFTEHTLIVLTFDESIPYGENNIYTVLLGDMVNKGTMEGGRYNHYSLLRTIEENFQLGTLGRNDAKADWFTFLLARDRQQSFNWSRHSQKAPEGVRNFHPDSTTVDCS